MRASANSLLKITHTNGRFRNGKQSPTLDNYRLQPVFMLVFALVKVIWCIKGSLVASYYRIRLQSRYMYFPDILTSSIVQDYHQYLDFLLKFIESIYSFTCLLIYVLISVYNVAMFDGFPICLYFLLVVTFPSISINSLKSNYFFITHHRPHYIRHIWGHHGIRCFRWLM